MSEYTYYKQELPKLHKRFGNTPNIRIFYRPDRKGYSGNMREVHRRIREWFDGDTGVAISFHFDAAGNPAVDGHSVLYTGLKPASKRLAEDIDAAFD